MKKFISALLVCFIMSAFPLCAKASTLEMCQGECPARVEQLPYYKKAPTSLVEITNYRAVVKKSNYLPVVFLNDVSTKTLNCNEKLQFVLPNGLKTVEGTMLLPCNTIVLASVKEIQRPKSFNRKAKLYLQFDEVLLPTDESLAMCAVPATNDCALSRTKWQAALKSAGWVVGGYGVGAGLGAAIGAAASAAWTGCWMGMAIGGGVGVIAAIVTPGLHYKAKKGDMIFIQLQDDFTIPCIQ
ncbi:hypothetical protein J6Q66_03245 [bacterium]|nr:hypothetical protein [bacterium]